MTPKEIDEAEKSFRISIRIWKILFILYGNWKWRFIYPISTWGGFLEIYEWHPFTPVLNWDERKKLCDLFMNKFINNN